MEFPLSIEQIRELENEVVLSNVILVEQAESWYDPCGKSGEDIREFLTPKSIAAIKRLRYLRGLDGSGGPPRK